MRSFLASTLHQKYYGDKVEKDEMGKAESAHRRGQIHTIFWLENLKGRDHRKT
jgi:hypothetical protein